MLTIMTDNPGTGLTSTVSTTRLTLYVAVSYALLGAFGLMLAIGPGYASPIFPSAGLALAVVLLYGPRALAGVWIGSLLLNIATTLQHGTLNTTTAALVLLIASGATTQAYAGYWLVNRWQGAAWRNLERELDALVFLLLGGGLSCLISAFIGVNGLYAAALIPRADFAYSWWNWYVGDILGVLIFAPLPLRLLNKSPGKWSDRPLYALLPVLLMISLLWLAFYGTAYLIKKDQQIRLNGDCEAVAKRISDRLLTHREVLASLHNFIEATPDFSFKQFEMFTKITLKDNPDIFALSFNDLVTSGQRLSFERTVSGLSPLGAFQITERDSEKRLIRATDRAEYVTVRYIVPLAGNKPAVGFDINSEPIRRDAINRARTTNTMAVTAPIQLVQEQKKRVGVLELMPVLEVRATGSGGYEDGRLLGFAVSVVKLDEMIEIATRGYLPSGLLFRVTDPTAAKDKGLIYSTDAIGVDKIPSGRRGDWKTELRMGDRKWEFTAFATDTYLRQQRPFIAWGIGIIAIIVTGLIQLIIIGIAGRASEIQRTNDAVNAYLDNLFIYANIPIIVWDSNFRITRFSKAFESLTGRTADELIMKEITTIFPAGDAADYMALLKKTATGERWETLELPIEHVNGTVSTILWNSFSIYGEDGVTPVATIAQGYDITGRKQLEMELQQSAFDLGDTNARLEQEVAERQMAQEALAVKQAQLEAINDSLTERIEKSITVIRQKDQLMISQSRQAAMGEMIGNIAHQWRQPINALAMVLGNIQQSYHYNELTPEYLDETVANGNRLIQKMSTTINDFRNFFLPDKEAVSFSARDQINHAVSLVEAGLTSHNIFIHLETGHNVIMTGFPNEYSQVLLNLLSNSREAIKGSGIPEGHITIRLSERDGQGRVSISDNGGGIPADVIDKIFEPYFSTKELGTGIGLYMSKMIIERSMNGTIEAHNIEGGAEFVISIPLERREP